MVSTIRQQGTIAYNQQVTDDVTTEKPQEQAAVGKTRVDESDGFEVTGGNSTAPATGVNPAAAPAAPEAAARPKKQNAISKAWDSGMKALIPLTKKEIKVNVDQSFKLDEAEKYKLDLNVDVDLQVADKGVTADQQAFFADNKGALLLTSKLAVDVTASATSPCVGIESGSLMGGIDIEVQMPVAIDPKAKPTKQVFTTMWDRLKATTVDLPYTAKAAKKLPQGTVVTSSFVVAGGISLGYADQSAEIDRRTQVTVSMERGKDGKIQLTVTKQRIDEHALDLATGDLLEHFQAGYERQSKLDRTTIEVYNVDLDNPEQMAALQKALPWTGGKHKLIPASDTGRLKELGLEDTQKAQEVRKRDFSDKLELKTDFDHFAGSVEVSRKYSDGRYTISNMTDVKVIQDKDKEKFVGSSRSNTLILPDKEAKLSPKQATAQASLLSQCNVAAWRTAPEGTKLTQLVSASLDLTTSDNTGDNGGQSAWQLDPSGKTAITLEITQTENGPTVTVIEQDKAALLAQLKGTNISADNELCEQIKQFGIFEAIEDYLQNDGKALKEKYYNSYDTIKEQLSTLIGEQLKYNYKAAAGGSTETTHQMTFGPFALADARQKEAFVGLTGNLDMGKAIDQGLLLGVTGGNRKSGTVGFDLNNYEAGVNGSGDTKRQVELARSGDELVITVTDTKVKSRGLDTKVNNLFGNNLDESDVGFSGSRTASSTEVRVYKLDLSKQEHLAAYTAAMARGHGSTADFALDFTEIDKLNVRDASLEKITVNKIFAGQVDAKFEEGPFGTAMQLGRNYKDGKHTISSLLNFKLTPFESDEEKKSVTLGSAVSAKVVIPDAAAELSDRTVRQLGNNLSQLDLTAWQEAKAGTIVEYTTGSNIGIKAGADVYTEEVSKAALWSAAPSGDYVSTIHIEQTDKGPKVTLIQTRKADILASFKLTKGEENIQVSDAIASFGLYDAMEDYLQNDGAKLKARYGTGKYAEISEELAKLVDEQKTKNIGTSANAGKSKSLSTTFGPFDLKDSKQQGMFLKAAAGDMTAALEAGFLASISSNKRWEGGGTVDYNASDASFQGAWDRGFKVDFQKNGDGTTSLVVTETKLNDTKTGVKLPDIIESVDVKFNSKIKDETTQIYVYDLDLTKAEHQAALNDLLAKINDHKAPEKAFDGVKALGVRNSDKEQVIKKSDTTGELGFDAKKSALGAAFTMGRSHTDGKYTFTNLFEFNKNWDKLANLPIGNIGALTAGLNVLGTNKVEITLPDNDGKMSMADASGLSFKLTLTDDDVWKDAPVGTAVTRLATGTIKINGQAYVGQDISLMDGLQASLKAGITIEPSTNKILGNTVTKTEEGLMVTLWQEDAKSIALGIEAEAKLNVTLSEFGIYNAVTDWLKGGEGLRQKLGTAAYEAADKALSKLISNYLNASLSAKITSTKEHKEKATFGPFDLTDETQKNAFDNIVRFYNANEAMKAGLLKSRQVDNSKITDKNFKLKISALEFAAQSTLARTDSDFSIKTDSGDILTFSAYEASYKKSGVNAFKGEKFTYNWDTFVVHKTFGDSAELVDLVFQGSFTMTDKRTHADEAGDWQKFCRSLNLFIENESVGKNKFASGYGKGDGKIQFGCSIGGFTKTLENWQPMAVRNSFMSTAAAFEGISPITSEVDRSVQGKLPLDSQALRLARQYNSSGRRGKANIEEQFKKLYPTCNYTMEQMGKAYALLEEYWLTSSDRKREDIEQKYSKLTGNVGNPKVDITIFLASYLIDIYSSKQNLMEQEDIILYEEQYKRLTEGRDLYTDVLLVERSDYFMNRMDEIHTKWEKAGGGEATAAMNEVVEGMTDFGRKVRPWAFELGREHEHNLFVNMAGFLSVIGQNNSAVEVVYDGQRFKLKAHSDEAVETKKTEDVVEGAKNKAIGRK